MQDCNCWLNKIFLPNKFHDYFNFKASDFQTGVPKFQSAYTAANTATCLKIK
jgi:hypothetical protein